MSMTGFKNRACHMRVRSLRVPQEKQQTSLDSKGDAMGKSHKHHGIVFSGINGDFCFRTVSNLNHSYVYVHVGFPIQRHSPFRGSGRTTRSPKYLHHWTAFIMGQFPIFSVASCILIQCLNFFAFCVEHQEFKILSNGSLLIFDGCVQGLVILTVQAHLPSLKPPPCSSAASGLPCQEPGGGKAAMLFLGLYLVALGVGCIKGSLPAHGAEQFDEETPQGRNQRSTFFSYFVFCLSCGALIAVTLVVWVEDNKGWEWGFGISTGTILLSIPLFLYGSATYRNKIPNGSPLTTMSKVLIGSIWNSCINWGSTRNAVVSMATSPVNPSRAVSGKEETEKCPEKDAIELPTDSLRFLNRALETKPTCSRLHCTAAEVEEVKIVMKIIPIFACTIMLNCCLAQLSTFSVQQAATMNTKLGSLTVPPASLPVFPVVFIMILAPIYDQIIVPFARKETKTEMGITHLQRIGSGLVLSIIAMAVAALVEIKRKRVASRSGLLDSSQSLPVTFFWIAFQYLFLGSADLFTLAGLMEFFFTEAPASMRSLATSLSFASLAMGYYLSSVLVSVVNRATGDRPWLSGSNLNRYHLERFYWLMCVLSILNFLHYLLWATRYKYRSLGNKT